jgi:putative aminopeptidase FrvX
LDRASAQAILEPLLTCPTAPYNENAVAEHICTVLDGLGVEHMTDRYGNIVARTSSTGRSTARIGFMAHMDHPGFEVTAMESTGVAANWYGGVDPGYFQDAPVRFYAGGEEFPGVIATANLDPETGLVASVRVRCDRTPPVGAVGMWDLPAPDFTNGVIRATAIDDVAGCGVLLGILTEIAGKDLDTEVWALFTRAEEAGFVGAVGLARSGKLPLSLPVVSVEMSNAMPGATQGMGPVVRLGDKSSVFDNGFLLYAKEVAAQLKKEASNPAFKYQQMLMDGGSCEATVLNAFGFRTAGLAIPLGNYHNQRPAPPNGPWVLAPEEINSADFVNAVELSVAMCQRFPGVQPVIDRHRRLLLDRAEGRLDKLERNQRGGTRS